MNSLWGNLGPLILGSALVPVQLVVTILLLRSSRLAAVACVVGMATLRLIQGLLFGLILSSGSTPASDTSGGRSALLSGLLLVISVLLLVAAARQFFTDQDPDAPPPKWMAMTESMRPGKAFAMGAGIIAISAKFWVFTLGAISAIGAAQLSHGGAILAFVAFIVLAQVLPLAVLAVAFLMPARSEALMAEASAWLHRNNRVIMIVIGITFGTWFLIKGLSGLGIL